MNAEQRAALRKLAEEATPGPWISDWDGTETLEDGEYADVSVWAGKAFDGKFINNVSFDNAIADGAYIATANPSTILQLLDYIETLEKDAARYRYLRDDGEGFDISVLERDAEDDELWVHGYPPEELEAAIDAAMQGETE